jgi:DNA uptake protein ComE-like DNA-binding protein
MQAILGLLFIGGLIWLGPWGWFILFLLVVVGVAANSKKGGEIKVPEPKAVHPKAPPFPVDGVPAGPQSLPENGWLVLLTDVCAQYSATNYFAGELIPTDKLYAALKAYPLPNGGFPVALIDTTIFVSPDCGMLIGKGGVSWHNWLVPTKISALEWKDLSKLAISIDGSKIKIGNDGVFETSGSQLGTGVIKAMLERLQEMWDKSQIPPPSTFDISDPLELPPTISPTPYPGSEWSGKLTEICAQYTSPDFYVAELIPQDKLEIALQTYPLNGGGRAIALIDATVFGSAKNGMLIGEYGLSWHHSNGHSTISTMSWAIFSELAVSVDGSKIKMGNNAVFETAGTRFDKIKIKSLLERIGGLWTESVAVAEPNASADEREVTKPMPQASEASESLKLDKTDINTADFDSLLALPGIGAADAKLLIQRRDSYGPLSSMDQLVTVLSLKPHIAERLRPLVTFSLVTSKPPESPKDPPTSHPTPKPTPTPPKSTGPARAPIDF